MNLSDLNLDVRTFNAVCRAGCKTVEELKQMLSDDPERLRLLIGRDKYKSVEEALAELPDCDCRTLSIESPYFAQMRTALNDMLQKTINSMIKRDSDESSITLKINLNLYHASDQLSRTVLRPEISHKITSAITVKDNTNGRLDGDYELIYDEKTACYIMRELPPDGGQLPLIGEANT